MMKPAFLCAAMCCFLAAGCQSRPPGDHSARVPRWKAPEPVQASSEPVQAPSKPLPPAGMARIESEKIVANDRIVRWQWRITGDRKWDRAAGSLASVALSRSPVMKSLPAIGGANVWECNLTVRAIKSPDVMIGKMAVGRILSLHAPGSEMAVNASGVDQGLVSIPSSQAVKLYVTHDTLVKLPARVALARVRLETTLGKDLSQTVVLHLSK